MGKVRAFILLRHALNICLFHFRYPQATYHVREADEIAVLGSYYAIWPRMPQLSRWTTPLLFLPLCLPTSGPSPPHPPPYRRMKRR